MKRNARNKNRREQSPKGSNRDLAVAMQELRRSNATVPIPSGTVYKRKPKHKEW